MATHLSTIAWKIPWMEELGRLQSMGSQRVGHFPSPSPSFNFTTSATWEALDPSIISDFSEIEYQYNIVK